MPCWKPSEGSRAGTPVSCPPELPPVDAWSAELLESLRETNQLWNGLVWAAEVLDTRAADDVLTAAGVPGTAGRRVGGEGAHLPAGSDEVGPRLDATSDTAAYHDWLAAHGMPSRLPALALAPATAPPDPTGGRAPLFSILVPVFRTPLWALERCVGSVLAQTHADFELLLSDDASGQPELEARMAQLCERDVRVRAVFCEARGGISAATNAALREARGEFVVFLDHDDELAPHALERMAAAVAADLLADVLYSDEDKCDEQGNLFTPSLKPDWSPDCLLSCAYMCHLLVVRRSLVERVGGLRSEFDGAQDHDLMLRATEAARSVAHVPEILYHWRVLAGSAAGDTGAKPWAYEAGRRAIADAMARRGEEATVEDSVIAGTFHVRRAVRGEPLVSVIVPFRDEPALLSQCYESICEAPGYDRYELVLIDNGSVLPETAAILDRLAADPRVVLLEEPAPFNWAAINNDAAALASGELLLFLNNDIEATTEGWMRALVEHAQRPEVGAVGARLLYPDRTVQHVGVVVGMHAGAAHVLQDIPEGSPGYLSWAFMTRDVSAVTGACLMTRRSAFEQVGGFSADLPIAFNDIDFCLKLRDKGYLVVFTPLAELVHHESRTRGHTDDEVELPRYISRWKHVLTAGDPYYNPNLSMWRLWCPLALPEEEQLWRSFRSNLEQSPRP